MDKDQIEKELKAAANGLLMLSETENPFEFFIREQPEKEVFDVDEVATWGGKASGDDVEIEDVDHFFRNMTHPHPDAGETMHAQAERYRLLVAKLKELLHDVKAYKMRNQGTEVFIMGRTPDGDYAGYRTLIVET